MLNNQVILVDQNDIPLGVAEKLDAHRKGLCHRAFSIFILRKNPGWEVLLQQRAENKYHSSNLWTNTCCSHPQPNEDLISGGERRLKEELGIEIPLKAIGRFHYEARFDNGLIENEVDHVLVGEYNNQEIVIDREEVQAYRWVGLQALGTELQSTPQKFTPWFGEAFQVMSLWLLETRP